MSLDSFKISSVVKALAVTVSVALASGTAAAHMTGANLGTQPGADLSGTATLPNGQTAEIIDQQECSTLR